ncbi:MAG: class A beta-lactamase-related serine hydrolase [Chitinophagaceae bacterium]|nr:MAG: class A beta-lactamase-related serine hydrolase [Chitinophagaceae bacterium]
MEQIKFINTLIRTIIVSVMLSVPAFYSFAQTYPNETMRVLDSIATQDVPDGAPGIATAIIEKGVISYKKCAGFADFTDSSMISADTRFNIASNGKQFTALAILTLIEKGKIKLSDNISRYLPGLFSGVDKKYKRCLRSLVVTRTYLVGAILFQ